MKTLLRSESLEVRIAEVLVCRNLHLSVKRGDIYAILGANGVGKTTLLHTLGGLHLAQSGGITLRDRPLTALPARQRARSIGMLFQDNTVNFPATVLETVLTGRHPYIQAWQWESPQDFAIAAQAMRDMELEPLAGRLVQQLSGGERRRVALAALLAQQTDILLLDEPTNHLDVKHQILLLERLLERATKNNAAVVMVLHDVNLAARFCNHALLLYGQGRYESGPADQVLTSENLSTLYDMDMRAVRSGVHTFFTPV